MQDVIKKCLPTYDVVRKIGSGVYGVVYHVKDNLKERAVKVVPIMVERSLSYRTSGDLDSKISHDFYAIQEYYHKIKGEGVIEIYDFHLVDKQVSKQEARAYLVILMEFCPYNLLDRVLDHFPLPPEAAEGLMTELAEILNRLSNRAGDAFIVKDLKPSNLLINQNNRLIIGDLGGLERISSTSATGSAQFTPNWSAPELLTHSRSAGIASLIFSYGFVSYFLWSGSLPYEQENFTERLRRIKDQDLEFTRPDIPFRIQILISQCLNFRPGDRPRDFKTILEYLMGGITKIPTAKKQQKNSSDSAEPAANPDTQPAAAPVQQNRSEDQIMEIPESKKADTSPPPRTYSPHHPGDNWVEPTVGMVFVWIPTGAFQMGCGTWDGEGNKDEFPLHEAFIDGFWLSKYPVTQDQWKKVMAGTLWYKVRGKNPSWFKKGGDYPVEQISWHDAKDFIQKLAAINKGRYHFSLPTEAEWEYASRSGGRQEKYPGAKSPEKIAWYSANSGMTTHPVGRLEPNGLDLYDMSGNVYEWCEDNYHEEAYRQHDYKNPVYLNGSRKVIRGGSWCNFPSELRCSYRASVNADFKGNYLGFRVIMTPVSKKRRT